MTLIPFTFTYLAVFAFLHNIDSGGNDVQHLPMRCDQSQPIPSLLVHCTKCRTILEQFSDGIGITDTRLEELVKNIKNIVHAPGSLQQRSVFSSYYLSFSLLFTSHSAKKVTLWKPEQQPLLLLYSWLMIPCQSITLFAVCIVCLPRQTLSVPNLVAGCKRVTQTGEFLTIHPFNETTDPLVGILLRCEFGINTINGR